MFDLKPDISLLSSKHDGSIEILEWDGMYGASSGNGLVDGVTYNGYETNTCYWYYIGSFVKFKIPQKSNIWIIGTDGQISNTFRMCLCDVNGNVITNDYCNKITSDYVRNTWQQYITNLPAGEYLLFNDESGKDYFFENGSVKTVLAENRPVHGEWYVESLQYDYLIKSNDLLYCISKEYYDTDTASYKNIENISFNEVFNHTYCDGLFDKLDYLNGKRPIDLFEDDIQLIVDDISCEYIIQGIKNSTELIVASGDIDLRFIQTLHHFKLFVDEKDNGKICMAFSTDKGKTWNSIVDNTISPLEISIPFGNYSYFTPEQHTQWNHAKNIISEQGISVSHFNAADFDTLLRKEDGTLPSCLRFAYSIQLPAYKSIAETDKLECKFDLKGYFKKMKENEYDVDLHGYYLTVTSLIDNPMIRVNLLL